MGLSNPAGGKGSGRRHSQVPKEKVDANWELIFGKKKTTPVEPEKKETK